MQVFKNIALLALLSSQAQALTFFKAETVSATISDKQAVCVYLANGYRPVTPTAVQAVKASGGSTCNDKAEALLHKATGEMFVKHNKRTLGEARYNQIKKAYYKFLAK